MPRTELGFTPEDVSRPFLPPAHTLVQDHEQPRFWWVVQEMVREAGLTYREGNVTEQLRGSLTADFEVPDEETIAQTFDRSWRVDIRVNQEPFTGTGTHIPSRALASVYGKNANEILANLRFELGRDLRREFAGHLIEGKEDA